MTSKQEVQARQCRAYESKIQEPNKAWSSNAPYWVVTTVAHGSDPPCFVDASPRGRALTLTFAEK